MSVMQSIVRTPVPWVSGAAIWAIAGASGLLNAWGWQQSAAGLVAFVLVALVIGSEVLGIRLAVAIEDVWRRRHWPRVVAAAALLIGVSAFNGYSGWRALGLIEAQRSAPYARAVERRAALEGELARIEADIAAVPAIPENTFGSRVRIYQEARMAELGRLEPQRAAVRERINALPIVESPPPGIEPAAMKLIVLLIEALKVFGLWAVAGHSQPQGQTSFRSAASELARKRWSKQAA